ncbi:hypothetical protein AX769_11345 [Frondihabitans sp. PAMC 28766]|nr:hypothetical protein AX769_11345 [Frondihabitans sp. PAMC 28766]
MDYDEVAGAANQLSSAADSGPASEVPTVSSCGSRAAESLLSDDGHTFKRAWHAACDGTQQLATDAITAADTYRATEAAVSAAAQSAAATAEVIAESIPSHG